MSTKRREYEYGRIVSVDVVPLGDNLAADVSSGATAITVEDAADFDENGGELLLGGSVYTYTDWTEDETSGVGTITLAGTLSAAAFEGDEVAVYDPMYGTIATDKVCQVELVGDDGNVDMLEAALALHLVDKLDEGVRGNNGEQVKLELEGDEWVIVDILGLGDPNTGPGSGTKFKRDIMTVTATGEQTFPLTYEPIQDSLHLRWEPINLDDTLWTRDVRTVTIPTPNYFEVGDVLTAKYAYRPGPVSSFGFEGPGWRYLVVTEADSTDRSGTGFDDSAWSTGPGAFGNRVAADSTPFSTPLGWHKPNTVTAVNIGLWIRKGFHGIAPHGVPLQVNLRVDGDASIYWDGTLLGTRSAAGLTDVDGFEITAAMRSTTDLLAIHLVDDASDPSFDFLYIDAQVAW